MTDRDDPLATVTHARLRAAQGDVRSARAILERVLVRRPGDVEAIDLLARLAGVAHADRPVPGAVAEPPPEPASGGQLAARFRAALAPHDRRAGAERLRRLLRRVEASRARTFEGGEKP